MIDLLVTCGDSFACGSGLEDEDAFERSYAGLTAKAIGVEQKVLARPGCCNFIIWLQIKYAVEKIAQTNNPFVLITMTNAARASWYKPLVEKGEPSLEYLNYQDYPPYDTHTRKNLRRPIPVETDNTLQSETLQNLDTFFEQGRNRGTWFQFHHEPEQRLRILRDWVAEFFDMQQKNQYDNGIMSMGHLLLKKNNIPHLFMGWQPEFENLLPEENYKAVDWGYWSKNYPDDKGTGHCDYTGHRLVHEEIIKKVKSQL